MYGLVKHYVGDQQEIIQKFHFLCKNESYCIMNLPVLNFLVVLYIVIPDDGLI